MAAYSSEFSCYGSYAFDQASLKDFWDVLSRYCGNGNCDISIRLIGGHEINESKFEEAFDNADVRSKQIVWVEIQGNGRGRARVDERCADLQLLAAPVVQEETLLFLFHSR